MHRSSPLPYSSSSTLYAPYSRKSSTGVPSGISLLPPSSKSRVSPPLYGGFALVVEKKGEIRHEERPPGTPAHLHVIMESTPFSEVVEMEIVVLERDTRGRPEDRGRDLRSGVDDELIDQDPKAGGVEERVGAGKGQKVKQRTGEGECGVKAEGSFLRIGL
ncbi:hypothetical protein NLJ89_g5017 [Agrocybe chaxingu]|uniref:Uncharacterized protein n=1 Tax=Agrocybe chaxingu TaxID=84603 RepID=A0A9W8K1T9_9AGAR|nr:hypothetical protein NLJ89_g5017 [Agrocybe chaxingu]